MKRYLPSLVLLFAFVLCTYPVIAATLQLQRIGTTSVTGTVSTWNHVGEANPALQGIASPAAQVSIKIDQVTYATLAATTSGAWRYQPTTATYGSHQVTITSLGETVMFTLNVASSSSTPAPTASAAALPATLPKTGGADALVLMASGGLMFVGLGILLWDRFSHAIEMEELENT